MMSKLFKNIRKQLAADNLPTGEASKDMVYLHHPIGVIILVVVGILMMKQI